MPLTDYASSVFVGLTATSIAYFFIPIWDSLSRQIVGGYFDRLDELDLPTAGWRNTIRVIGSLILASIILGVITGTAILAIAFSGIMIFLMPILLSGFIARETSRIRGQIVEACVAISNACRAGLALPEAIKVASQEADMPMAKTLERINLEYAHGRSLPDVLHDAKCKLNLNEFSLFTAAVLTCWDRGGNLPLTLDRISTSLQEHHRLEKKIESDTAEGKKVVSILSVFPILFLVAFIFLYPAGTMLYVTTISGQLMLVGIAVIIFGAIQWSGKIVAIDS